MNISNASAPADKITLFRSLFRGRQDVWPRRFESVKTGRAGYSPVCGNEWVSGVCDKPRVKCADCRHQRWLPVTDEVIRQHLSGRDERGRAFVAGVYPMLLDEHCFFLAVDFDEGDWAADALAFVATCERLGVPAVLERSRSGHGGHVWIFFGEAVPASMARRLGSHVLTETMEQRPEVGLKSYDRFFPNQDTLPRGGFGNLIALPLQKAARDLGNSVFVDGGWSPLRTSGRFWRVFGEWIGPIWSGSYARRTGGGGLWECGWPCSRMTMRSRGRSPRRGSGWSCRAVNCRRVPA